MLRKKTYKMRKRKSNDKKIEPSKKPLAVLVSNKICILRKWDIFINISHDVDHSPLQVGEWISFIPNLLHGSLDHAVGFGLGNLVVNYVMTRMKCWLSPCSSFSLMIMCSFDIIFVIAANLHQSVKIYKGILEKLSGFVPIYKGLC